LFLWLVGLYAMRRGTDTSTAGPFVAK